MLNIRNEIWLESLSIIACAYQVVRSVSFSENFAYVLNGWSHTSLIKEQEIWVLLNIRRKTLWISFHGQDTQEGDNILLLVLHSYETLCSMKILWTLFLIGGADSQN